MEGELVEYEARREAPEDDEKKEEGKEEGTDKDEVIRVSRAFEVTIFCLAHIFATSHHRAVRC